MTTADDDETVVDQLIAQQPGSVAALIRKADLRLKAGDDQIANAFYRAALKAAAQGSPDVPQAELQRAQQTIDRLAVGFEDYLEASLVSAGFDAAHRPPRFQKAIDILLGRRQAVSTLQNPRSFFFPDLPQRRYYENSEFPWAAELQDRTAAIQQELAPLMTHGTGFKPYLYSDPAVPPKHGLVDNPDWSSFTLWDGGIPIDENVEKCPETLAALQRTDLFRLETRAPQIMFSKLAGGAHIEPHLGLLNVRLVCHLPLIVPERCVFTVGGEDRQWHVGELLTFDDSILHEARNDSGQDRVVLIFEIWRPELSADERRAVTALFNAVDSY